MGANCSSSSTTAIAQSHSQHLRNQSGASQQHLAKGQECTAKDDVPAVSVKESHESQPSPQAEKAQDFPSEKAEVAQPITEPAEKPAEPISEPQPQPQQQQPAEEQEQSFAPATSQIAVEPAELDDVPPPEISEPVPSSVPVEAVEEEPKAAIVEESAAPIESFAPTENIPAAEPAELIAQEQEAPSQPAIIESLGAPASAEEELESASVAASAVFPEPIVEESSPAPQGIPSDLPAEPSAAIEAAAEASQEKPAEFIAATPEVDAAISPPSQSVGALFAEEPVAAADEPQPIEQVHNAESVSRQLAETPVAIEAPSGAANA